ncbi:MAG TPA: hypothetical protein VHM00_08755 [Caldimonas sp.]|jgi:hypothetical protein|nr:hypothetical protein [Caldimonas sp.]HEX2541158.1 hypothetical protein [Caldimonas sp.]
MSFSVVAVATSIVAILLGLGWLFAGRLVLKRWGIEADSGGLLVGRRLGVTYLAFAIVLLLGSQAPPSPLRSALSAAMLVGLLLLALLGVFELRARRASRGILISVAVEAVLALGFAWVLFARPPG